MLDWNRSAEMIGPLINSFFSMTFCLKGAIEAIQLLYTKRELIHNYELFFIIRVFELII